MKLQCIVGLSGAFVLAQTALAGQAAPDAKALGRTEAIFSYCAKIDPSSGPKYQERLKLVSHGASDEVIAKVRQSDEYQQAHQSVDDFVSKVDEHNAMKVCTNALAQNK